MWSSIDKMLNIGDKLDDNVVLEQYDPGSFAYVYKVLDEVSSNTLALKLCKAAQKEDIDRFRDENQILHELFPHKNIIAPKSVVIDSNPPHIYYTMELADSNLDKLLISADQTDRRKMQIFSEVCEGLQHAHQNNIIHRDLHFGNVLVVGETGIKINDFGLGRAFKSKRLANSLKPCWGWFVSPPEFCFRLLSDSTNVEDFTCGDIYALGIILYYLFEAAPLDYVDNIQTNISTYLVRRGVRLEDLSRDEITVLYRDWMKTFSQSGRPSAKLSVSSISDNEANEKVNEIVRKATNLDFDLRYQNVSEVLEDVRSIHL